MPALYKQFVLVTAFLFPLVASAQSTGALGHVRFVVAHSIEGKVHVLWDGQEMDPDGYIPGARTGDLAFPAGMHQLRIQHNALPPATFPVMIAPGSGKTFIIYTGEMRQLATTPKLAAAVKAEFKLVTLDQVPGKEQNVCFFALPGAAAGTAAVDDQSVALKALEPLRIKNITGGKKRAHDILLNNTKMTYVRFDSDSGEFAFVFFKDSTNTVRCVKFENILVE